MKTIFLLALMTMAPLASTAPSTPASRMQAATVTPNMTVVHMPTWDNHPDDAASYYTYLVPQSPR